MEKFALPVENHIELPRLVQLLRILRDQKTILCNVVIESGGKGKHQPRFAGPHVIGFQRNGNDEEIVPLPEIDGFSVRRPARRTALLTDSCQWPPPPAAAQTYASRRPVSSAVYVTHCPSGENDASISLNGLRKRGRGLRSPVSGSSDTSDPVAGVPSRYRRNLPSEEIDNGGAEGKSTAASPEPSALRIIVRRGGPAP